MSSFRVLPSAPSTRGQANESGTGQTNGSGHSRMEFDYYHEGTEEEFEKYYGFVRQVALEDFELCERTQGNLERGVYREGVLNPVKEGGVLFYQGRVKECVYRQFEVEKGEREMEMAEKGEEKVEIGGGVSAGVVVL